MIKHSKNFADIIYFCAAY